MRAKVTENGVLIPKGWLEGIDEVEIQKTHSMIIVVPEQADDPIFNLGKQPVLLDVEDASLNHDRLRPINVVFVDTGSLLALEIANDQPQGRVRCAHVRRAARFLSCA